MTFIGRILDILPVPLPDFLGQGTLQTVRQVGFEIRGVTVVTTLVPVPGNQTYSFEYCYSNVSHQWLLSLLTTVQMALPVGGTRFLARGQVWQMERKDRRQEESEESHARQRKEQHFDESR